MVRDFRAFTACNCLLLPVFFHCVRAHTTNRQSYDSVCLELYPLFACDTHNVPVVSTSNMSPVKSNSPRRLVRFPGDSRIDTLSKLSSENKCTSSKLIPRGPMFSNSPFIVPRDTKDAPFIFRNVP